MKCKFSWAHWHEPTPKRMKMLGTALATTFGGGAVSSFVTGHQWIGAACVVLGLAGKFLSEFYADAQ